MAGRIGVPVSEGRFPLERMKQADEVIALSTLREIQPVVRIGDVTKDVGPITTRLKAELQRLIREETAG